MGFGCWLAVSRLVGISSRIALLMSLIQPLNPRLTFIINFICSTFVGDKDHLRAFDLVTAALRLGWCRLRLIVYHCFFECTNWCSASDGIPVLIVIVKIPSAVGVAMFELINEFWIITRCTEQL